jgi:hypothetical protein
VFARTRIQLCGTTSLLLSILPISNRNGGARRDASSSCRHRPNHDAGGEGRTRRDIRRQCVQDVSAVVRQAIMGLRRVPRNA